MNRRQAIGSIAGAVAVTAVTTRASHAKDAKPAFAPVAPGGHKPVPLPFNPAKLPGLSEKLLTSHHDNNYAGAVKGLNLVELELDKVTKDTHGFLVAGLREHELTYANSAYLHESTSATSRTSAAMANPPATSRKRCRRNSAQPRAGRRSSERPPCRSAVGPAGR